MIPDVIKIDLMTWDNAQSPFASHYGRVIVQVNCVRIEQDVAIGAEAQNIIQRVRPVVRLSERSDMAAFCIGRCDPELQHLIGCR